MIVTTPQEVALIDARKASSMFAKVNVPVLGIIENMSYFFSPSDGQRFDIFGSGGGEREAARLKVPLLGAVPLTLKQEKQAIAACRSSLRNRTTRFLKYLKKLPINYAERLSLPLVIDRL